MTRRIIAIAFIFACATVAWVILGATIFHRTESSTTELRGTVQANWGAPQEQGSPRATYDVKVTKVVNTRDGEGKMTAVPSEQVEQVGIPLVRSRVAADLKLEPRLKGLLWQSTYTVKFAGTYTFHNTSNQDSLTLRFPFPAQQAVYDNVTVAVNGQPVSTENITGGVAVPVKVARGDTITLFVGYNSRGMDWWRYTFSGQSPEVAQVRDFELKLTTNFKNYDIAQNALSATNPVETKNGWILEWKYNNLVTGYPIGIVMPEKLQPGPLAGRISFFAPVSLFFFFFLMFIITTVRGINMHPMNYFFLAAAFFAFHVLLAYLVDHISIHAAFIIASAVSVALVVSYLRLVVDSRFAMREAALTQILFLVLFSYAFFFKGFTGLAITIGSIITLFIVMQMTGRIRWEEKFAQVKK